MDEQTRPEGKGFLSKVPGFRTGKTWKKVIASTVYGFIALIIVLGIIGSNIADKEYADLINKAENAMAREAYVDAVQYYESANDTLTLKSADESNYKKCYEIVQSDESYKKGIQALSDGKLSDAVTHLKSVSKFDKNNFSQSQEKLEEAQNRLAEQLLTEAKSSYNSGDYKTAYIKLTSAIETTTPDYQPAAQLLTTYKAKHDEQIAREQAEQKRQAELEKIQEINNYKNQCQQMAYKVLNKNPDSLAGTKVALKGEIMQIQESATSTFMLVSVTYQGYDIWSDNVAVFYPSTIDVYEDDIINFWGEVKGAFSYESTAGWNITVPAINAKYIEK